MFERQGPAGDRGRQLRGEKPAGTRLRISAAIRVAVAVLLAAAATAAGVLLAHTPEPPTTDVVGYPIVSNYNIENLINTYYAIVLFFPIAVLLIFLGLTRLGPRIGLAAPPPRGRLIPPQGQIPGGSQLEPEPASEVPRVLERALRAGRIALVAAVIGLETAIVTGGLWPGFVLGAAAYALIALLMAAGWSKSRADGSLDVRLGAINAVAAALTLAGLVAVSLTTEVTVIADGSQQGYPWFPAWLGLPIGIGLMAWLAVRVRGAKSTAQVLTIERRALLVLAAPVGLFLFIATLPGDIGSLEFFESGQGLMGATLMGEGWLPWRDVIPAHGMLLDAGNPGLGFAMFEDSQWGRLAGYSLLLAPLYLISTFFLFAYLFRRNIPFLFLAGLVILGTTYLPADTRHAFWPLILLMLAAALNHPSRLRSAALAVLVFAQALVTPEATPAVLAITAVVVLYEFYWREPGSPVASAFRRTLWFTAAGLVSAAAFALYMGIRGGLDDYFWVTTNLIEGHLLSGGIEPRTNEMSDAHFAFQAIVPVVALLIAFAYAVARLRLRRPFVTEDWVVGAVALFLGAYYLKFLAYMDSGHLSQVVAIAVPLVLYIAYRAINSAELHLRGRWASKPILQATHPVSLVLVLVVAVVTWGRVEERVDDIETRFQPNVPAAPLYERVGYSSDPYDPVMYRDLKRVVDAYLGPDDQIFDFTNAPTLFNYLMDREPSTRNIVVLIAHSEILQEDLVDQLRESPPKLIVFDSLVNGLTAWDGVPNMARHYAVSQWILDNYRPLLTTHSTTFYVRRDMPSLSQIGLDLEEKPITKDVAFSGQPCPWGYAPNYLSGQSWPGDGARGVDARARPADTRLNVIGWAGDPKAEQPAREVLVTADGEVLARVKPGISRPDLISYGLPEGFARAGFQIRMPVERGKQVRLFGVSRSGSLTELVAKGEKPDRGAVEIDGRRTDLVPDAVYGQLNTSTSEFVTQINRPAGSRWSDYRFLEIDAGPGGLREDTLTTYDRRNATTSREISFQTLDSSPQRYIVPVGSCAQWHGYRGDRLYISSSTNQDVAGVRLFR